MITPFHSNSLLAAICNMQYHKQTIALVIKSSYFPVSLATNWGKWFIAVCTQMI